MTDSVAIEQLTIDDVNFSVADLPEEIQGAVRKYEEWRDRYVLAQDEVQLVASALRDLGAQIVAGVRAAEQEKADAELAAVEAETQADEMASEGAPVTSAPVAVEVPVAAAVEPVGETLVVDDAS